MNLEQILLAIMKNVDTNYILISEADMKPDPDAVIHIERVPGGYRLTLKSQAVIDTA